MAKSKKTKKAPKVSVARILGLCLLGLLAIGAVANVIKALPKEENPIVEELPGENETPGGEELPGENETPGGEDSNIKQFFLELDDEPCDLQYEEGMTWYEWCYSDYNTIGLDADMDYVVLAPRNLMCYDGSGYRYVLASDLVGVPSSSYFVE